MITRLRGTLLECELTSIVIDVHGVGYELTVPMSTYDQLPRVGETVSLLTHLHVREDAWQLFGFTTPAERLLFRRLIAVSGIGPRLALNVLSCMSVRTFCETIIQADIKALSRVSGIGKRSAERLVVELREKLEDISPEAAVRGAPAADAWPREAQDAIAALETLGFKSEAARKAVQNLLDESGAEKPSAENLIRKALMQLNS